MSHNRDETICFVYTTEHHLFSPLFPLPCCSSLSAVSHSEGHQTLSTDGARSEAPSAQAPRALSAIEEHMAAHTCTLKIVKMCPQNTKKQSENVFRRALGPQLTAG